MCGGGDNEYSEKDKTAAGKPENQTPEHMKKGIVLERRCTDKLMCLLFSIFFCGMFATAAYGYKFGDPSKLITPFDSDGYECGKNATVKDYPYLYWPALVQKIPAIDTTVCVKSCPGFYETPECRTNSKVQECTANNYTTTLYLNRFCLPNATEYKQILVEKITGGNLGKYMGDLGTAWWIFLVMGGITTVIACLYLFLLRYFAKPILYISFILIFVLLIGGGIYVYLQNARYESGDNTKNIMKGMGILLWILAGLYFIILLCCCSRIQLGVAIMEATSEFVRDTTSIFLVPFIFFFINAVWIVFWVFSAIWVFSVGEAEKADGLPLANIQWNSTTRYVWIYHLFGLFWISAFIIGCAQFIIAATTCIWYFAQGGSSDDKARASLRTGFKWVFVYHMGSIAFGALIIAIMQMIKLLFEYMRKKYEKAIPNNPCTKCLICCLRCCIWCLDCCVKFITKNAYIQIALTNNNFCGAAWATFCLIVRNAARFGIIAGIGAILMFVGKALIIVLSGWIAYLIIMNSELKDKVYSPVFPVIVVVIIAYLISSIFLSVYSFSSTAILHAFLLDEEVKGNRAPKSLQSFIERNDKINAKRNGGKQQDYKQQDDAKKQDAVDNKGKEAKTSNDMA